MSYFFRYGKGVCLSKITSEIPYLCAVFYGIVPLQLILDKIAHLANFGGWESPHLFALGGALLAALCGTLLLGRIYQHLPAFLEARSQLLYALLEAARMPAYGFLYLSTLFSFLWKTAPNLPAPEGGAPGYWQSWYGVLSFLMLLYFAFRLSKRIRRLLESSYTMRRHVGSDTFRLSCLLFDVNLLLLFCRVLIHSKLLLKEVPEMVMPVLQSVIITSFTVILLYGLYVGMQQLAYFWRRQGHGVLAAFIHALTTPLLLMVAGLGVLSLMQATRLGGDLNHYLKLYTGLVLMPRLIVLGTLFVGLYRASSLMEEQLLTGHLTRKPVDKTTVQIMGNLSRTAILGVGFLLLFATQVEGLDRFFTYFATSATVIGGIAAKDLVGNYLGGLVMQMEGKFRVGDWIYSVDKQVEGVIEYLGARTTQLRTFDRRVLDVPNSFFFSSSIVNASRMTSRRIFQTLSIKPVQHAAVGQITRDVETMLQNHPGVDLGQPLMVHLIELTPVALKLNIYAFTRTKDLQTFRNVQQDVLLKAIRVIEKHGASLAHYAFPIAEQDSN